MYYEIPYTNDDRAINFRTFNRPIFHFSLIFFTEKTILSPPVP